jgi:hypothetical protein
MKRSNCILILSALLASACVQPPTNGAGRSQEGDWAAILALEDQAKAIAKTSGCSTVSQCRTAPVGNRACGGPRYYVAYCATSTDSVALFSKLAEVSAAEDAFNRKYQIGSTCEYRMPSPLALSGGECRMVQQ